MNTRKLTFSGFLFDGQIAAKQPVRIHLKPGHLVLDIGDKKSLTWAFPDVRLQPPDQDHIIHLDHPVKTASGERLETLVVEDSNFLTSLHAFGPDAPGQKFHRQKKIKFAALWVGLVFVPLFVYTIWAFVVPTMVDRVADKVPITWEEDLGDQVYNFLWAGKSKKTPAQTQKALETILDRLLQVVPDQPYNIRVHVHPAEMINALALPGGHIVIFQGLLNATDSAEELAGVLAHEVQHVLLRHSTRGILRSMASELLLKLMVGDANGVMQEALGLAGSLEGLKFSRKMEGEADAKGMEMMLGAGIDPEGMVIVFQKLKEVEDEMRGKKEDAPADDGLQWMDYLSTHPPGEDRVSLLQAMIKNSPLDSALPLLPKQDWKKLVHQKSKKAELDSDKIKR